MVDSCEKPGFWLRCTLRGMYVASSSWSRRIDKMSEVVQHLLTMTSRTCLRCCCFCIFFCGAFDACCIYQTRSKFLHQPKLQFFLPFVLSKRVLGIILIGGRRLKQPLLSARTKQPYQLLLSFFLSFPFPSQFSSC